MAGPRLKSIKWWEGRRDVCGTVCIDTWWENLPLLAHVGNTPSQFLPPQQNRKQRLGKSYLLWMQEMFPLKHEQVRQRSHYSASGLTWHVLAEVRLLVSFSSERGHFSPIMELSKEKGREVGEVIIRLTELILRVHMVSLRDSQDVNFSDRTFSRLLKLIHKTSVSCF